MKLSRLFTQTQRRPYDGLTFERRSSRITNPDGTVVFEASDMEVPQGWSQVAVDIMAQKYFRKAGVPTRLRRVAEEGVPEWLWRSEPDERRARQAGAGAAQHVGESDSRQLFNRLAGCWTYWGWKHGYFADEDSARVFYDELTTMLASQAVAPNSPQWFNTGLHWAYGITGPAQGHSYCDEKTGELRWSTAPTSGRSRTRASSSRSATTSSARAASWTCGSARRASSSTARAPAPTSRAARRGRAAVGRRALERPDELPAHRRPRGRRDQERRDHPARRQDGRRRRRPPGRRAASSTGR
jgi:hypothetical protein